MVVGRTQRALIEKKLEGLAQTVRKVQVEEKEKLLVVRACVSGDCLVCPVVLSSAQLTAS